MSETDNPKLTAEIQTEQDDPQLKITVERNGKVYEETTSDVGLLVQNRQFVNSFQRPVLALLSLYEGEQTTERDTQDEYAADELDDIQTA